MDELYTVRGLRRCFGDREVLNIPELTLESCTIYGLLGPNGSGKTTLMRLLAFMDPPTEGDIFYRGERITPERYHQFRGKVVWVPQTPVMFTGTLLYNVEYPMRIRHLPAQERRERAYELLEVVGLEHLAQAPARRLSGGEAQRGSIARALAAGAEVILFDEPTASVDFRSRGDIIRLIHSLWEHNGLSIIVTTHDFDLAAEVCQEEISLFEGRIVSRYPLAADAGVAVIPRGVTAYRGELAVMGGEFVVTVHNRSDDAAATFPGAGAGGILAVVGMAESAAGVTLRLRAMPGHDIDIHVTGEDGMALAKTMTLGNAVRVR